MAVRLPPTSLPSCCAIVATLILGVAACSQESGETVSPLPAETVPVYQIQGDGKASPLNGRRLMVTGIVTGDFQDGDADEQSDLGGFFLQARSGDGDPSTSDGVFIFDDPMRIDVSAGDRVEVLGTVVESDGETQVVAEDVRIVGRDHVEPVVLSLPAARFERNADGALTADLEAWEGMLVRLDAAATIVDAFNLERFGTLQVSVSRSRPQQFTNRTRPDRDAYRAHRQQFARSTLLLDDGNDASNRADVRYAGSAGRFPRLGDTVSSLVGVLSYRRGGGTDGLLTYRLMPVKSPAIASGGQTGESVQPPNVGGNVRVMSFNALNFFTTIDDGNRQCGPRRNAGCRGADSTAEFNRQRAKLITAMREADVHVIGLMEVENGTDAPLISLTEGLNEDGGSWKFVESGPLGDDVIRVALLYDSATVVPEGSHAILDSSEDRRFDDQMNRPALAQTFRLSGKPGAVTVAVNHLKSKGSPCDDAGDPNLRDGQGNCNGTRMRAAAALADWLKSDPTGSQDPDVLIIGDLNAYTFEDPVLALESSGFANLLTTERSRVPYSFVFRGEIGALDHALASESLVGRGQVADAAEWHINADVPPLMDYNLDRGRNSRYFDATSPLRASDHDPIIVGLELKP